MNYKNKQIEWVYCVKFIGILAVILGHIDSPLSKFIFTWHMPLFFIIAGFFVKFDLTFKEFLLKDLKRLMIPYLIFSLIALIITQVKNIALGRESLDLLQAVSGVFIWMDMSSLSNTYAFVLWFLPALFFSRSVLFLIRKYINNMFIQFLVVFFLFSLSFYIDVPFGFDNALNALLFVFIGNVAFSSFQNNGWLFVSLPSVVLIYMYIEMPLLDMASKNYSNIIINILLSVSTVHLLILLLKSIDLNFDLIRFWAKNTMLLFIAHVYTNNAAHIVVEYLNYGGWPLKLLISIVLLHMLLLVKLIFNNKLIFKYV